MKYIIFIVLLLSLSLSAQDILCNFETDKNINIYSTAMYDYCTEKLDNIQEINGSSVYYCVCVKKVKCNKTYAMLTMSFGNILVEYTVKEDGSVNKIKNTKMSAWKFDFTEKTCTYVNDIDDTEIYEDHEITIKDKINVLIDQRQIQEIED